ncbi:hypothetical protein ACIP4Q_08695 [Streptomyces massasporeus]
MGPKVLGAQTHFHRTISESFHVLSGEIRLYDGKSWVTGRRRHDSYFVQTPATPENLG